MFCHGAGLRSWLCARWGPASGAFEIAGEGVFRAAPLPFAPCPEFGRHQPTDEFPPADIAFEQAAVAALVQRDRPDPALQVFQPCLELGRLLAADISLAAIVELVLAAVIVRLRRGRRLPRFPLRVPVPARARACARRSSRARRGVRADGRAGRARRGGMRRGCGRRAAAAPGSRPGRRAAARASAAGASLAASAAASAGRGSVAVITSPCRSGSGGSLCRARFARWRASASAPARFARLIARAERQTHVSRRFCGYFFGSGGSGPGRLFPQGQLTTLFSGSSPFGN